MKIFICIYRFSGSFDFFMSLFRIIFSCFAIVFMLFFSTSCRKEKLTTDGNAKLEFSADTLAFDTVFTTLGSTTLSFRVFNNNNRKVNISNIELGGGENSMFKLNIDGVPGFQMQNLEIDGKDSFQVFASVTVNPTNQNNPIIFTDSVLFETNGNVQKVYLVAWGQDAHFFVSEELTNSQNWINDKPYVILNSMLVGRNTTLTIEPGVRIFMGGGSGIFVDEFAKIIAKGTCDDSISIRNIRQEEFFQLLPGQWLGVFFLRNSVGNEFDHVEIANATFGISLGSCVDCGPPDLVPLSSRASLKITNSLVSNSSVNAIASVSSQIEAENCLFAGAGDNLVSIGLGGIYQFTHCTFANFGSRFLEHKKATLLLSNVISDGQQNFAAEALSATFDNSIIFGSLEEEIDTSIVLPDTSRFRYQFNNCLLKTKRNIDEPTYFTNCLKNMNPLFVNSFENDYHLSSGSPAIDAGKSTQVFTDFDCVSRNGVPDLGCYEFL